MSQQDEVDDLRSRLELAECENKMLREQLRQLRDERDAANHRCHVMAKENEELRAEISSGHTRL